MSFAGEIESMTKKAFFAVPVTCALIVACGGAGGGGGGGGGNAKHPRTYPQAAAYCELECARKKECASTLDDKRCKSKCDYLSKEYVSSLRPDHLETIEACVKAAPCEEIGDKAFETVVIPKERCWLALSPKLTPLGEKTAAALKARATACQDSGFGASEAIFGGLTDAILNDLQTCLDSDRSCKNFLACTKSVAGLI